MTSSANEPSEPAEPPAEPSGTGPRPLPGAMAFVGLGTSAAGCVAVGLFLGVWVDGLTHTSPLFLVVGLVLGLAAAVGALVTLVRRFL